MFSPKSILSDTQICIFLNGISFASTSVICCLFATALLLTLKERGQCPLCSCCYFWHFIHFLGCFKGHCRWCTGHRQELLSLTIHSWWRRVKWWRKWRRTKRTGGQSRKKNEEVEKVIREGFEMALKWAKFHRAEQSEQDKKGCVWIRVSTDLNVWWEVNYDKALGKYNTENT